MVKWKGIVLILLIVVVSGLSGLLVSNQLTEAKTEISASSNYVNEEMGLSIAIPPSWNNNYVVKIISQNEDGFKSLVFTEKRYRFPLLQIALIPENHWGKYEKATYLSLGNKDGFVYGAILAPETFYLTDEKDKKKEVTFITEMLGDMQEILNNKEYTLLKKRN